MSSGRSPSRIRCRSRAMRRRHPQLVFRAPDAGEQQAVMQLADAEHREARQFPVDQPIRQFTNVVVRKAKQRWDVDGVGVGRNRVDCRLQRLTDGDRRDLNSQRCDHSCCLGREVVLESLQRRLVDQRREFRHVRRLREIMQIVVDAVQIRNIDEVAFSAGAVHERKILQLMVYDDRCDHGLRQVRMPARNVADEHAEADHDVDVGVGQLPVENRARRRPVSSHRPASCRQGSAHRTRRPSVS